GFAPKDTDAAQQVRIVLEVDTVITGVDHPVVGDHGQHRARGHPRGEDGHQRIHPSELLEPGFGAGAVHVPDGVEVPVVAVDEGTPGTAERLQHSGHQLLGARSGSEMAGTAQHGTGHPGPDVEVGYQAHDLHPVRRGTFEHRPLRLDRLRWKVLPQIGEPLRGSVNTTAQCVHDGGNVLRTVEGDDVSENTMFGQALTHQPNAFKCGRTSSLPTRAKRYPTMPCSPEGSPAPSEARLEAVGAGKPARSTEPRRASSVRAGAFSQCRASSSAPRPSTKRKAAARAGPTPSWSSCPGTPRAEASEGVTADRVSDRYAGTPIS